MIQSHTSFVCCSENWHTIIKNDHLNMWSLKQINGFDIIPIYYDILNVVFDLSSMVVLQAITTAILNKLAS